MQPDMRLQLLTEAEVVVRRVGYAGFSYADLAKRVQHPQAQHPSPLSDQGGPRRRPG